MAKVKIQGNASGTGVLTVTAPNTSTDRTITLPDSTDTLAVNSDVTNKLPLAGGTLTGTLNVTNELPSIKLTDTNSGGYYSSVNQEGSSFKILADEGNVGSGQIRFYVGSGPEKVRILASGGLTFNGDTAAANALDDYEEGTWTPTGTALAGGAAGTYTKIGNVVTVEGYFKSNATSTTRTSFGGLPFAAGNFNVTNVTGVGNSSYNTQQNSLIVRVDEQAATFSFCQSSSSISLGDANSENSFTITYKVS